MLGSLEAELISSPDPLAVLDAFRKDNPRLRMYRLAARPRLHKRLLFWRIVSGLAAGLTPKDLPMGLRRGDKSLVSGLLELMPARLVCAPLVARLQPFVAVVTTSLGAQVAVVSPAVFARPMQMTSWPTGMPSMSFAGPGIGVYKSKASKTIPDGVSPDLLGDFVSGANKLVDHLSDPGQWASGGDVDIDERWIAWTSVRLGLDAVNEIGAEWQSPSTLWAAFRSLGVLQGIWEGSQSRVRLADLLDPRRVREVVLPRIRNDWYRTWCEGVIDNYEAALIHAYPSLSMDDLLPKFEEVRHLVHGVGAQANKKRTRAARLETLRVLDEKSPNVQLVIDIATLWWAAVILDPRHCCVVGHAPWLPQVRTS